MITQNQIKALETHLDRKDPLRDRIAIAAMQSLLVNQRGIAGSLPSPVVIAKNAYGYADAMLEERNK